MTYVADVNDPAQPAANYVVEPYPSFADAADALKKIKYERRIELAMEGHRFFDLTRWGEAETVINTYVANEERTIAGMENVNTFEAKHYRLPIPINAIDLSGGILSQNPGF